MHVCHLLECACFCVYKSVSVCRYAFVCVFVSVCSCFLLGTVLGPVGSHSATLRCIRSLVAASAQEESGQDRFCSSRGLHYLFLVAETLLLVSSSDCECKGLPVASCVCPSFAVERVVFSKCSTPVHCASFVYEWMDGCVIVIGCVVNPGGVGGCIMMRVYATPDTSGRTSTSGRCRHNTYDASRRRRPPFFGCSWGVG